MSTRILMWPATLACLVALPTPAYGETPTESAAVEPAPPANYVVGVLGTTLGYRPPGGEFLGPQKDLAPAVGFGRFVTDTVALELDLGVVLNGEGYLATTLTPGVVWAFHPNAYAAGRAIVVVAPEANLVLLPGIGVIHPFEGGFAPLAELNVSSAIGRGEPDFGVAVSVGALYAF